MMPMPKGMPMGQGGMPGQDSAQPSQDQEGPGKASQLVADIHDQMMQLMDMVQQAKLPPQDAQQLSSIIQSFQQFVEQTLGSSGENPQESEAPGASGAESPEAGGNPNAKPA